MSFDVFEQIQQIFKTIIQEHISIFMIYSVPFDIKKPLGFYAVFTLQCLSGITYMTLVSIFSGLFIGMCTYIDTCVKDLSTFTDELNKIVNGNKTNRIQRKIDVFTADMVQFHTDILKLVMRFTEFLKFVNLNIFEFSKIEYIEIFEI